MSTKQGMVERGITTAEADYMIHFFPLLRAVHWYRSEHARAFIARYNPPCELFKSKDGSTTGAGYLINNKAYFVSSADIPDRYCTHLPWGELTNREAGFAGEEVVEVLIEHGIVRLPSRRSICERNREKQFGSMDGKVVWLREATYEVKTEVVTTPNLCIQTHEGGHKVHLANRGGQVVTRVTAAPTFEDDVPF